MSVGIGAYQGATVDSIRPALTAVKLWLCHLCPDIAKAVRAANPRSLIILRPDVGDDNAQFDATKDPQAEARRYADLISQRLVEVPPGTYSATTGPNEAWPSKDDKVALRWRAAFELALCRQMQTGLKLAYAALSVPTGNLEAADVALFADVFREAWAVNYHGYLAPGNSNLLQENEPYYNFRPTALWLPELQKLGIPLRLLFGECGTYYVPTFYPDYDTTKEATVTTDVAQHYAVNARDTGAYTFIGACCFGVGTVGAEAPWDLTPALSVLVDAAKGEPQPSAIQLPGGKTVPTNPPPTPHTFSVGPGVAAKLAEKGDTPTSDELYLGSEISFTTGHKGLYVYSKAGNQTLFLPAA